MFSDVNRPMVIELTIIRCSETIILFKNTVLYVVFILLGTGKNKLPVVIYFHLCPRITLRMDDIVFLPKDNLEEMIMI
jgi:hypothetical protein